MVGSVQKMLADLTAWFSKKGRIQLLNLRIPANNRPYGWTTVKSILIDNDYTITESRSKNLRFAIIEPAADG